MDSIITNCRKNIKRIVDESKDLGATVILTTIFPVGEAPIQRQPFWSDDIRLAVNEMNVYSVPTATEVQRLPHAEKTLLHFPLSWRKERG